MHRSSLGIVFRCLNFSQRFRSNAGPLIGYQGELGRKLILKLEILIADWRRLESLAPIGRAKENLASIWIIVLAAQTLSARRDGRQVFSDLLFISVPWKNSEPYFCSHWIIIKWPRRLQNRFECITWFFSENLKNCFNLLILFVFVSNSLSSRRQCCKTERQ